MTVRTLISAILAVSLAACATGDVGDGVPSGDDETLQNNVIDPNDPAKSDCTGAECPSDVNCVDGDGDGYGVGCAAGPDCDDADFQRASGYQETCDGKDNDCNEIVDDLPNCDADACIDADGDGQGMQCPAGADCDDGDAERFDGAPEACDTKDNDCDGVTDEDYALGEPCTAGEGECQADGVTVCSADGVGTACDAPTGTPGTEVCDQLDNDCDGSVDEGLNCPACIEESHEPNDRNGEGTPLSSGSESGQLCPGTVDWYRLGSFGAGATVSVSATFSHADGDIDIDLYVNSAFVAASFSGSDNESISHTLSTSGTVDLRVYYPGNASPGADGAAYTVTIQ